MPALGVLLTSLFGSLVAWLTQFVTRKVAFGAAGLAMWGTLSTGLFVVFRQTIQVFASMGDGGVSAIFMQGLQMVIPPQTTYLVSGYITLWVACTAWKWQTDLIKIAMTAG